MAPGTFILIDYQNFHNFLLLRVEDRFAWGPLRLRSAALPFEGKGKDLSAFAFALSKALLKALWAAPPSSG
jgi:hypothetical protein